MVALAVTGIAAKAFHRRRRLLAKRRRRHAGLALRHFELKMTLLKIERQLRFGGNPPGAHSMSMPTETLRELAGLRDQLVLQEARLTEARVRGGLLGYLHAKKTDAKLAALDARVVVNTAQIRALSAKIDGAWLRGERLP